MVENNNASGSDNQTGGPFSNVSLPSVPAISLPKGGGAIRGIGEKFHTNQATGTGTFTIPIPTSPGRSGFGPRFALSYDSGKGNGPFGMGWGLDVPSIARKTDKGLPRYRDNEETDVFVISGAEDLVPLMVKSNGSWSRENLPPRQLHGKTYSISRYRPRLEGMFGRIERWCNQADSSDTFWRATDRGNVTTVYGATANSRIFDPNDPSRIFSWLVCETYDDKGDVVRYEYKQEDSAGVSSSKAHERNRSIQSRSANRYLKSIKYGNRTPYFPEFDPVAPVTPLPTEWLFEVVFDYGEHNVDVPLPVESGVWPCRNDPFSSYRAGFEIRTYRLCRRVLMFHHFPNESGVGANCLVRSTNFTYVADRNPADPGNAIFSFLASTHQSGYQRNNGGYVRKDAPSIDFEYSQAEVHSEILEIDPKSLENVPAGLGDRNYLWVDLDGEGLSGILTAQGNGWFYKRNLSPLTITNTAGQTKVSAKFAPLEKVALKPSLANLEGQQLIDLAGDGELDLVDFNKPTPGFYERTADENWTPFTPFKTLPNLNWNDRNLRFVDLTGDGRADILIADENAFTWYSSAGEDGYEPGETVRHALDEEKAPRLVFADETQSIFLANMSGSGLNDLVRIRNNEIVYWPNLGYGRFGAKVSMDNAPLFDAPDQFDYRRIRMADIDGSGLTDVIYLDQSGVKLFFNQSGNSWSEGPSLAFPTVDNLSSVSVVDLLGTGTSCIVWSSPLMSQAVPAMRYVDLMASQKPHLLVRVVNNLGGEVRARYAPSTKFYLADKFAGRPWITKIPFPVHVLERLETFDHISRTRFVNEYKYHHGYYDGVERELRGFGMVEQIDSEAFEDYVAGVTRFEGNQELAPELYQPPVLTRTWFHTGAYFDRERIVHQFRKEYYGEEQHTPEPALPSEVSTEELQECLRALKGLPLRQEMYSFDKSAQEQHPYTVTENNYEVRLIQPRGTQKHGVFLAAGTESITFNYERNPNDPRITHTLNLEFDQYGQTVKSCSVVYGRKSVDATLPPEVSRDQQRSFITYGEVDYTTDIDRATPAPAYRLRVPCDERTFEITGISPAAEFYAIDELKAKIAGAASIQYEETADGLTVQKRMLAQRRTLFLDNNLQPLALGSLDSLGLVYQTYQLAFTPGVLTLYPPGQISSADFAAAGYVNFAGDNNWWVPSATAIYPANPSNHFYQPTGTKDPLGLETIATFDQYDLLVEQVQAKQAAWNITAAVNDYRVLAPVLTTDQNKNQQAVELDPLGMVVKQAVMGKAGAGEGDTLSDPTIRMEYELFNWVNNRKPNFVHTFAREKHGAANPRWQESYVYSNGSGKVAMVKAQAHPGKALQVNDDGSLIEVDANPRWVGSSRIIQNNKGNPVKQYQPYFSTTHEYEDEKALSRIGTTPVLYYDPLGRNIRTEYADGTQSRVETNPWLQRTFDANDLVKESHWYVDRGSPDPATEPEPLNDPARRAAWLAAKHAGTPGVVHLDSLARSIYAISDYGGGKTAAVRSEIDLTGRTSRIFDQHQREVSSGFAGMMGTPISGKSNEKGRRWTFLNVLGALVKMWDEHGHTFRAEYDVLNRPVSTFFKQAGQPEILFNYVVYGDRLNGAEERNLLGMAHQIFDQDGVVQIGEVDFKGNPKLVERALANDYKNTIDWSVLTTQRDYESLQLAAQKALENEIFSARSDYDALNRATSVVLPDGTVIVPTYNEASFVTSLSAQIRGQGQFVEFLKDQDYEANGQRKFSQLGNGILIQYFHDPASFRLTRLLSYKTGNDPDRAALQDLNYTYDPVGNVTTLRDRAQQTHYFNNAVVLPENNYEFDAINQLIRASGRELAGGRNDSLRDHQDLEFVPQLPHQNDLNAVRTYTEEYEYDLLGNIKTLRHRFASQRVGNGWTRHYRYLYEDDPTDTTNRLSATNLPGDPEDGPFSATYAYDAGGNMTRMPHLPGLNWNFMDQLRHVDLGGGGDAYYVYDTGHQRIRKVIERQNGLRVERIYLGALEIYRERQSDNAPHFERYSLTIADDSGPIAQIDTKTIDTNLSDRSNPLNVPNIRYQHTNRLGSANVETDEAGNVISYEEFHPFGTSSYRSAKPGFDLSMKRYRFTGKELDNETGLYYFGARYYAPWLGRWTSSDTGGMADGTNTYAYCRNCPVNQTDPLGLQSSVQYDFEDDVIEVGPPQVIEKQEFTGKETLSELQALPMPEGYHFNPNIEEKNLGAFWQPGPGEGGAGGSWLVLVPNASGNGTGNGNAPAPSPPSEQPIAQPSPEPQSGGEGAGKEKEREFFTSSFFKGLVVGVGITLAVVAVVATGGAALAVIAPAAYGALAGSAVVGTGLAIAGGVGIAVGAAGIVQSVRQRDLWNNPISEEQANFNLGMGIGSFAGGPLAKPVAGAGTTLGQGIGREVVGAGQGLANLVEGGGQLAIAGGGVFGGEMAIAAPATAGITTTTAVGVTGSAIGATTMAMAGHQADWELRNPDGRIETRGRVQSGSDTPPGRRLTWDEQLAVHTERKILDMVGGRVKPGQTITIRGTKPPCDPGARGCSTAMLDFARKYGVKIKYTDTTTGMTYEYP